jgi:hypothetical protein
LTSDDVLSAGLAGCAGGGREGLALAFPFSVKANDDAAKGCVAAPITKAGVADCTERDEDSKEGKETSAVDETVGVGLEDDAGCLFFGGRNMLICLLFIGRGASGAESGSVF